MITSRDCNGFICILRYRELVVLERRGEYHIHTTCIYAPIVIICLLASSSIQEVSQYKA